MFDSLSRRERERLRKVVLIISIVLIVSVIAVAGFALSTNDSIFAKKDTEPPTSTNGTYVTHDNGVSEVSDATQERLDAGTILNFGNPQAPQTITVLTDPRAMKKGDKFDMSKLIPALETGKVRMNLYLYPSKDTDTEGVGSMVRVAACVRSIDKDNKNINTLKSIMAAAQDFKGSEDIVSMSRKMGAKEDMNCSNKVGESSSKTTDNATHFMTQYSMDAPEALFVGDGVIIGKDNIKSNWIDLVILDKDIDDMAVEEK